MVGDEHRVLPLRGQRVVFRYDGPAIREISNMPLPRIQDRFHCEGHSRLQCPAGFQTRRNADVKHPAVITVMAVFAHDVIHRDTRRPRKSDIQAGRTGTPLFDDESHTFIIQLARRDAGHDEVADVIQNFGNGDRGLCGRGSCRRSSDNQREQKNADEPSEHGSLPGLGVPAG